MDARAKQRESATSKGRDRKNRTVCPSRKSRGYPFPVTVGALIGACFPPIMSWGRHNDSHFLRALCTKQHPGVSKDCLVRLVMLHRHDASPSVGRGYTHPSKAPSEVHPPIHRSTYASLQESTSNARRYARVALTRRLCARSARGWSAHGAG